MIERVQALGIDTQIVVVDDCSADGTAEAVAAVEGVELLRHDRNQGKGAALRTGFARCAGAGVVVQDADLEYDPADIPALIQPILDGHADVVFGSRLIGGRPQRVHLFWHKVGNRLLSLLTDVLYNTTLSDMETGYKAFTLEVLRQIEPLRESRLPDRAGAHGQDLPRRLPHLRAADQLLRPQLRRGQEDHLARRLPRDVGPRQVPVHAVSPTTRRACRAWSARRCRWAAAGSRCATSSWDEVGDALGNAQYTWLVPALAALGAGVWLRSERWRHLFVPSERPGRAPVFWAMNIGYLFNNILPARAGEVARVLALSRETGLARTHGLVTIVVERIFDLASLAILLLALLFYLPSGHLARDLVIASAVILVLCAVLVGVLALRPVRQRALRLLHRLPFLGSERALRTARSIALGLGSLRQARLALPVSALSMASWLDARPLQLVRPAGVLDRHPVARRDLRARGDQPGDGPAVGRGGHRRVRVGRAGGARGLRGAEGARAVGGARPARRQHRPVLRAGGHRDPADGGEPQGLLTPPGRGPCHDGPRDGAHQRAPDLRRAAGRHRRGVPRRAAGGGSRWRRRGCRPEPAGADAVPRRHPEPGAAGQGLRATWRPCSIWSASTPSGRSSR